MGLFDRFRRGGGASGVGGGGFRQVLDREGGPADLEHLRAFAKTREGVAFYIEPETTATDTTVVAVAFDGEWTRRRVGTPRAAEKLARSVKVACHDVTVTGYPPEMRAWNARAKADRAALEEMARAESDRRDDRDR
ncbi:hypothetical protein Acsp06_02260 [Actinomycetospora sp. NBRC 106375]|uniref:hypothetical protein n=1 Tax=Actinomycetospora sp. NBRC 106375 TaxID=3032207 RepID=UPI0024A2AD13|nr:hypothetical protein [Actinomycetospora sp. NBRC 106375]GLZ44041.1 hypothetical protein Acsp06_02260 [Actinomycetospora sp. NBRC 106375]